MRTFYLSNSYKKIKLFIILFYTRLIVRQLIILVIDKCKQERYALFMIKLREIRKSYDAGKQKLEVLKSIDLNIEAGELVSIRNYKSAFTKKVS